jgi:hypothetical protein
MCIYVYTLLKTIPDENNFSFSFRYAELIGSTLKTVTELSGGDTSKASLMYSGIDLVSKISKGPKKVFLYDDIIISSLSLPSSLSRLYYLDCFLESKKSITKSCGLVDSRFTISQLDESI